ncbi:hypothetical protein BJV74DRAFT_59566 [Russula compacta]|nr:hypothetical protein BJV74DRAFT_59566 [Russula compacta]
MVDFRDSAVVTQLAFAVVKLWHTLAGLYIWEFVTTLDYEWSVIRGHRPYRWSIWVYSAARAATLMAVILSLVALDISPPYNCQVLVTLEFTSGYVAIAASSLLIVLRIIAIWNRNRVVVVIALVTWAANFSIIIHGAVQLRSVHRPAFNHACWLAPPAPSWRRLLCSGTPPLEAGTDLAIACHSCGSPTTTRIYRALVDRASRPIEIMKEPAGGNIVPKTEQTTTVPMRFRQMEVPMNTVCEQHATSRTSRQSSCIDINMGGQRPSKPYELSLEDDLDSGTEILIAVIFGLYLMSPCIGPFPFLYIT